MVVAVWMASFVSPKERSDWLALFMGARN